MDNSVNLSGRSGHFYASEAIAGGAKPRDDAGKGVEEARSGLGGVVEDDEGAVAGVTGGDVDDFVGGESGIVVAGDDVEHDELIAGCAESRLLGGGEAAVGRAEEATVDEVGGELDVAHVGRGG